MNSLSRITHTVYKYHENDSYSYTIYAGIFTDVYSVRAIYVDGVMTECKICVLFENHIEYDYLNAYKIAPRSYTRVIGNVIICDMYDDILYDILGDFVKYSELRFYAELAALLPVANSQIGRYRDLTVIRNSHTTHIIDADFCTLVYNHETGKRIFYAGVGYNGATSGDFMSEKSARIIMRSADYLRDIEYTPYFNSDPSIAQSHASGYIAPSAHFTDIEIACDKK